MIIIVGPTGVGKSKLSIDIAKKVSGEVVNFDSRQIYKHMYVGTATPSISEQDNIPHHLYGFIDPKIQFSVYDFRIHVKTKIDEIKDRGNTPILVGGTGQYIWSLVENWDLSDIPPNNNLRKDLDFVLQNHGIKGLQEFLVKLPNFTNQIEIDFNNPRRVIRLIEKLLNPTPDISNNSKKHITNNMQILGITIDRTTLYSKVDNRIKQMFCHNSLPEEVNSLIQKGYTDSLSAMTSIGYLETAQLLKNEIDLDTCIEKIQFRTHKYIRSQYNWFKLNDSRIQWFNLTDIPKTQILDKINHHISLLT